MTVKDFKILAQKEEKKLAKNKKVVEKLSTQATAATSGTTSLNKALNGLKIDLKVKIPSKVELGMKR